jgi:hypothetical protein
MLRGYSLLPFQEGHGASHVDTAVWFSPRWCGPVPRCDGLLRGRISSVFWQMQSRRSTGVEHDSRPRVPQHQAEEVRVGASLYQAIYKVTHLHSKSPDLKTFERTKSVLILD